MKKIKVGVLGYGFSGKRFQCPFIEAHEAYELVAIVQRHGNESKEDYPNIKLLRSYDELLVIEDIDLIIISTPNYLHYEHARLALEADKHVVVEKPYTATYEQALELNKLAEEKGKVITVYQNRRYDGDFLTIKNIVDSDEKVYEFEAVWDRFVPKIIDRWKEEGLEATNLLYDLGTHFLDQVFTLFGEPKTFKGVTNILRPESKIIDYFSIQLSYEDKEVRIKSSLIAAKADIRYKLHTNKGTYHFYVMGEQEHQLIEGMKPNDELYGDNAVYDFYDYQGVNHKQQVIKGSYMEYFSQLAKAIRGEGQAPVTPEEAARLMKYLEQIIR